VVLGVGLFLASLRRIAVRQRASILAEERIAEAASALAGGLRDVVACGGEPIAGAVVGGHIDAQAQATRELARFTAVRILVVALGGWVPIVLVLASGSLLIERGATAGMIVGALTYVAQGVQPALQTLVRQLGGAGLWLTVTLTRILEAADVPATPSAAEPAAELGWRLRPQHAVRLQAVTFAYGPFAQPVIAGLDLEIPDGDHLAIVGPSGVGKSTLAGLITGVLEPQSGDVRIGALPLRRLDPGDLAAHRVLIPQEAYVFAGTLHENLTYLRPEAGRGQLEHAVAELGLRPVVARVGGYAAALYRARPSAGARELDTLLRASLTPARLVVLDEATCHLDPAAEARVEAAFARRPGTVIVIAHRISSALRARRVLVLDGAQARLGTHEELLGASALYRDLVGHWTAGSRPEAG
jgi:ATP-binding cassette subfamily C protein